MRTRRGMGGAAPPPRRGRRGLARGRRRGACASVRGMGYASAKIAVGGDSAGAGLTLALIGELRAQGEDLPGCAWLISPWTDLSLSGATLTSKDALDPIIH